MKAAIIYMKSLPLVLMSAALMLSSASQAATVDGEPSYNLQSDSGLYVWRTGGDSWHVRLVAGDSPLAFEGDFKSSQALESVQRAWVDDADSVTRPSADTLRIAFESWPGGSDGADFSIASNASLCLRNTGPAVPVFLGQNAVRASAPVSLAGSGACGGATSAGGDGLYISRTSGGDWQVRLVSDNAAQKFSGDFEAVRTVDWVQRVQMESADSATRPSSSIVRTHFESWPGGYDGINFAVANDAGVCLRDTGSSNAQVYLGTTQANAVAVNTPLDLTGSGACGQSPDPVSPPTGGRKFNPGHYISLMRGNDGQTVMANSMRAGVVGFVKRYTWRELEPSLGQYNFSEIASDLAFLSGQGMHLIVMIEDKTFVNEKPTPGYLQGWQYTRPNRPGGFTAIRWAPYVVTRKKALFEALGRRFDDERYFEGIGTQETAPGLDRATLDATGYTPEKYRNALIEVLSAATRSMPTSRVFWMMNFLPQQQSYIGDIASALAPLGVIMGGPDVMPDEESLQRHTYPYYHEFEDNMPLFGQIEPACYAHMHEDTSYPTKYWTMPELFRYGRDNLGVDYMFWVRLPRPTPSDSYDWHDALPVISNNLGFNN